MSTAQEIADRISSIVLAEIPSGPTLDTTAGPMEMVPPTVRQGVRAMILAMVVEVHALELRLAALESGDAT